MKKNNDSDLEQRMTVDGLNKPHQQTHPHGNEELSLGSADIEDEIQLERREAYTEQPAQKLLRTLIETDREIFPTYNPALGFTYETIEPIFQERTPHEKPSDFLERLTRLDILKRSFFDSISTCPTCNSPIITLHHRCPKCRSHHIQKTSLREHIPCGYIAERERYVKGLCPKCGVALTETSFRDMGRWFICKECGEKFEQAQIDVICRKCGKVFNVEDTKTIEIPKYSLNQQRKKEIRQNVTSLGSLSKVLGELGFKVEMPGHVVGLKSGMQHHFSIMAKKEDEFGENIITIDHAVGETEVPASAIILYIYKISEVKVDLPIFVAIPKLNDTAKKIAQGNRILLIEGSLEGNEMSKIKNEIETRLNPADQDNGGSDENKSSMWKRPLLRREDKKPQLIEVVSSIHPNHEPAESRKKKSFMSVFKKKSKDDSD